MDPIDVLGIRIPEWLPVVVLGGLALVVIAIPLRLVWSATRGLRERRRKLDDFADRLRERFNEVSIHRALIGPDSIDFRHEGRSVRATVHGDRSLSISLEPQPPVEFPCVIAPHRRLRLPWTFCGFRLLPRMRMFDPLVDESVAIYTTPVMGNFLREQILDALSPEGKPSEIAESFVVLRRVPGAKRFRLSTAPGGPVTMHLSLRTEDVFYRPDELESLVHHLGVLAGRLGTQGPVDPAPPLE